MPGTVCAGPSHPSFVFLASKPPKDVTQRLQLIFCVCVCSAGCFMFERTQRGKRESFKWFQDVLKPLLQTACHGIPSAPCLDCSGLLQYIHTSHTFPGAGNSTLQTGDFTFPKSNYSPSFVFVLTQQQDPTAGTSRAGFCPHPPSASQEKKKQKRKKLFAVGFSFSLYLDNGLTAFQLQGSCEETTSITYRLTGSWSYLEREFSLGSYPWK